MTFREHILEGAFLILRKSLEQNAVQMPELVKKEGRDTTPPMSKIVRRTFLGGLSSASAASLATGSALARKSPNEIPNLAAVGVGGKGWADSQGAAKHANIVAFCDVEQTKSGKRGGFASAARTWPRARRYTDWRVMLEKEKNLDGLTVSTPDHMHAPVTMTALQQGIGCYTQKPLTRTIHESRKVTEVAARVGVATQMGNQHHSGSSYRTLVNIVQTGLLGKIKVAHAWSNRPIWPQGIQRPSQSAAPPRDLLWDLWLGVAPDRPFAAGVSHPFKWRGWYDFGTGALGDMGCHIIDPVYWALDLTAPDTILCEGPEPAKETFPKEERIYYEFPGTARTAGKTIKVTWHDGGKLPDPSECDLPAGTKLPANGCMFVGEQGVAVCPHGSGKLPDLYPKEKFKGLDFQVYPSTDHYRQWVDAIRGEGKPSSGFDYAGPLCEAVLLGCVASRSPGLKLEWNAKAMRFNNSKEADNLLHQQYRKGWEVSGL
ncbi:MAG: Gfo/Idh/MocA family oxidoreductase [Roseibacillus sp.]|nr:Gfo/Idh/MocA family oxidoreductase [Roseibacillus sp.]